MFVNKIYERRPSLTDAFFDGIRGVVWDFDGVLVPESERVNISAAAKTFADLGQPLTPREIVSITGKSSKKYIPPLLRARGIGPNRDEELIALNRKNYDALWPEYAVIAPGLIGVLLHLQRNNTALAIATTNRRSVVDLFLKTKLPIPNPFRVIVTGEEAQKHKPDPEVYQVAATNLDIAPTHLLAIEDTSVGIKSAKAAGLRCAAIHNSFSNNQDFSEADYRLKSLKELLAI